MKAQAPPQSIAASAPTRQRRRRIRWVVRLAVVGLIAGWLVFVGLDGKFYYPDRLVYDAPDAFGVTCTDVAIPTRDGLKLHGWFLPAVGAAKATVLHFHGNAANVSAHISLVAWLPSQGFNVLMFDYRGYGRSEGRVTREGTIIDGHAALDFLLARPDVDCRRIVAYGQSLGGAVATVVAAERNEIRGVVLEATFSSYRRIAAMHVARLPGIGFFSGPLAAATISSGRDPIDCIARLSPRPVLIIAGENDPICFPELGRELFDAAAEPKEFWLAPGSDHLEILLDHDVELQARVTTLIEAALR
ncbi:Haloalkane dehalogenase [Phycisphaerae bacterium RAS1]|nr:Haloalkane dehalogenase [Phycisphaerae bacterium RAS1]